MVCCVSLNQTCPKPIKRCDHSGASQVGPRSADRGRLPRGAGDATCSVSASSARDDSCELYGTPRSMRTSPGRQSMYLVKRELGRLAYIATRPAYCCLKVREMKKTRALTRCTNTQSRYSSGAAQHSQKQGFDRSARHRVCASSKF